MKPRLKFSYRDNTWLNERGDAAAAAFEASRHQRLSVEERQGDTGNLSYKDFSQFKIIQL